MHILLTGGAGFIGSHLAESLIQQGGHSLTVIDNFDPFYDRSIKEQNLSLLRKLPGFRLVEGDIRNLDLIEQRLDEHYDAIIHVAAKAGVLPSIKDPIGYEDTNVKGTLHLLEFARKRQIKQFVFCSSSSVYGVNPKTPWHESDPVLLPISPYASTKVAGELCGYTYAHLYNIRFIALRLFTVYGPRQRPDLAIHKFAKKILQNEPITMYGDGSTLRDYTNVADIVRGITAALHYSGSMYEIINLGNNNPVNLSELIAGIEKSLNKKAIIEKLPEQPGDVPVTFADIQKAGRLLGYHPQVSLQDGLDEFCRWLKA
jgi:UDP-glucuronate 4-epimerase